MRVKVDPEICIGCGLCASTCPEVFRMEADKALAFADPVPQDKKDLAQKAVDECPVIAILVVEK